MPYRARVLSVVLSLLGLTVAGCTRAPQLASFSMLLAEPAHSAKSERGARSGETSASFPAVEAMRLDQLQLKGSHNSFHQAPRMALARSWRYSHRPLREQLARQGVRQIELDVRFSGGQVVVGHLPLVDGRTSCSTLRSCLRELRGWSTDNPGHLPLFVFIEPKEHLAPSNLDGRIEVLDHTIGQVFPRSSILLPEQVAGDAPSLRAALNARGWPSLESARGKVVFVLFGRENHTRAYAKGRPRLEGRLMFAAGKPDDPYAAFASCDDPVKNGEQIQEALAQHMLVRTRADANLRRDTKRRDAALSSGAHFIGSDFVDPKTNWLAIGGRAPARCNPLSATSACTASTLRETQEPVVASAADPAAAAPIP
jgi:hypothetical protein